MKILFLKILYIFEAIILLLWISFPKHIMYLPIIGEYDLPGISYFDIFQFIPILNKYYVT